jgi:lysophospholipase L1-like esterase
MGRLVADVQPDLVIISLGANEMSNTDPPAHARAVRRIVEAVGGRPCVWVSPPTWGPDTGILDVIRENSAPCRYFDSDDVIKVPIPRQRDHVHPNIQGGAIWADGFWQWLLQERDPGGVGPDGAKQPWLLRPSPSGEHMARSHGAAHAPRG